MVGNYENKSIMTLTQINFNHGKVDQVKNLCNKQFMYNICDKYTKSTLVTEICFCISCIEIFYGFWEAYA